MSEKPYPANGTRGLGKETADMANKKMSTKAAKAAKRIGKAIEDNCRPLSDEDKAAVFDEIRVRLPDAPKKKATPRKAAASTPRATSRRAA